MSQDDYESLRKQFAELRTHDDVARILNVPWEHLELLLFVQPDKDRYKIFNIPKKRPGEQRQIASPNPLLKQIQHRLSEVLQAVYFYKDRMGDSVHGFVPNRSIVSNAATHTAPRWVLNIDLKDFFPSITFQRVRTLFMGPPYYQDASIASILARICCFQTAPQSIPQGAPTSPVLSNMSCRVMDREINELLTRLGKKGIRCRYTRYADDLTISSSLAFIPPEIATSRLRRVGRYRKMTVRVGGELASIIKRNDFKINARKVRLFRQGERQEVTGLIVNAKPNVDRKLINQVRAMLHAWERYGYEQAQMEFFTRYDHKPRNPAKREHTYQQVVRGKIEFIGMVRGKADSTYLRLLEQYRGLIGPNHLDTTGASGQWFELAVDGIDRFQPYFGKPLDRKFVPSDVLLLTPMRALTGKGAEEGTLAQNRDVYTQVIEPTLKKMGYKVGYSDELMQAPERVMKNVWSAICAAEFIVAIISGNNADIFYQMGIAHTLGKPVLLLARRDEQIPFDLIDSRLFLHYDDTEAGKDLLRYTLRETIKLNSNHASLGSNKVVVKPRFGSPVLTAPNNSDVFLIMPFKPEFDVLHKSLSTMAREMKLTISRGSDFLTSQDTLDDIWSAICASRMVIADCTQRNPGVFYQLAIAHTIGVESLILTQRTDDVPNTVRALRYVVYKGTPRGRLQLETELRKRLVAVFQE